VYAGAPIALAKLGGIGSVAGQTLATASSQRKERGMRKQKRAPRLPDLPASDPKPEAAPSTPPSINDLMKLRNFWGPTTGPLCFGCSERSPTPIGRCVLASIVTGSPMDSPTLSTLKMVPARHS